METNSLKITRSAEINFEPLKELFTHLEADDFVSMLDHAISDLIELTGCNVGDRHAYVSNQVFHLTSMRNALIKGGAILKID